MTDRQGGETPPDDAGEFDARGSDARGSDARGSDASGRGSDGGAGGRGAGEGAGARDLAPARRDTPEWVLEESELLERVKDRREIPEYFHEPDDPGTTIVAQTATRTVVPIILVTAVALLLQGHNLPGGGFIAGVLTATAFLLVYANYGLAYLQTELLRAGRTVTDDEGMVSAFRLVFSAGLAISLAAGLAPLLFDFPLLAQGVWFLHGVPLYGELEVASALAFDLGVYLAVIGALLVILGEVGRD